MNGDKVESGVASQKEAGLRDVLLTSVKNNLTRRFRTGILALRKDHGSTSTVREVKEGIPVEEVRDRILTYAALQSVDLSPERLSALLNPKNYLAADGSFDHKDLQISEVRERGDMGLASRLDFTPEGEVSPDRALDKRDLYSLQLIEAFQDYFILIGTGIINNVPETIYCATNASFGSFLERRYGFKSKVGSYGGVVHSTSTEELRDRVFSKNVNDAVIRLQGRLNSPKDTK